MSQQPRCKWSMQQLVLHNKTLSDRRINSGALSLHAHYHTYSTWQQRLVVRFPCGCAPAVTTSLKNKSWWWKLSSLRCKNKNSTPGGELCLGQKYACCGQTADRPQVRDDIYNTDEHFSLQTNKCGKQKIFFLKTLIFLNKTMHFHWGSTPSKDADSLKQYFHIINANSMSI